MRQINHVEGPTGWTQSFDNDTVDLLLHMGLIKFDKVTSNDSWEVKFYVQNKG